MRQGANRYERAHNYVCAGHAAAGTLQTTCAWTIIDVLGVVMTAGACPPPQYQSCLPQCIRRSLIMRPSAIYDPMPAKPEHPSSLSDAPIFGLSTQRGAERKPGAPKFTDWRDPTETLGTPRSMVTVERQRSVRRQFRALIYTG